jgi:hypothetical protein
MEAQRHSAPLIPLEGQTASMFLPPPLLTPIPVAMPITAKCKRHAISRIWRDALLSGRAGLTMKPTFLMLREEMPHIERRDTARGFYR